MRRLETFRANLTFFSQFDRYLEYNDFAVFPDGLFEDAFSLQYL